MSDADPTLESPRRRPSRPSLRDGEHSTSVNLSLPDSDYGHLCTVAQQQRTTVPRLVRGVLTKVPRRHGDRSKLF